MIDEKTEMIVSTEADARVKRDFSPRLFVCQRHGIAEYRLDGRQLMGRPTEDSLPHIPIENRFVSRHHGIFDTEGVLTTFTAVSSTNGIAFRGKKMDPGEKVVLTDGDELSISVAENDEKRNEYIILVYAATAARIRLWRSFRRSACDDLTGLCSRESFIAWWQQSYWKKDYTQSVFFIMDIDDFKKINDCCGHNMGDHVIRQIALELKNSVRYEQQVCRWGGDEFVGVMPGYPEQVELRFKQLIGKIARIRLEDCPPVTVSIGYVQLGDAEDASDVTALVGLADKALYYVKREGKNGLCSYSMARAHEEREENDK